MKNILTSVAAIALLSSGIALAADEPGNTSPRFACKPDVDRLCPGVQPGGGRIKACLKQNDAQLSAACKDAIANARQKKTPPPPATPGG